MGHEFTGAVSDGALCLVKEGSLVNGAPTFAARILGGVNEPMASGCDLGQQHIDPAHLFLIEVVDEVHDPLKLLSECMRSLLELSQHLTSS